MADITVLRVEVSNVDVETEGSLSTKKGSTVNSLAGGALAGKYLTKGFDSEAERIGNEINRAISTNGRGTSKDSRSGMRNQAKAKLRSAFLSSRTPFEKANGLRDSRYGYLSKGIVQYGRNMPMPSKTQVTGAISSAAAVYGLYSSYKQAGYSMSGATHAAEVQSRKGAMSSGLTQLGVAAMINPAAVPAVIAMKAYQLAQTNRKELFEIRKSVIQSSVLQRNLVSNIAESRF